MHVRVPYNRPMLLLRWIKRESFVNREFGRYLRYALGEILLVIAGIIIALQIDSWHESRQNQQRLNEYLANIAQNIADDTDRVSDIKAIRAETIFATFTTFLVTTDPSSGDEGSFNSTLTSVAHDALEKAQKKLYLVSNTGGYRALESSGLISELPDARIESLLYDYYRTVDRIAGMEQDLNNTIGELTLRFQTETARDVPQIILSEPLLLWQTESWRDSETLQREQRNYWELLAAPVTNALLRAPQNQPLMREYENLLYLGDQLTRRIDEVLGHVTARRNEASQYVAGGVQGHPVLLESGLPGYHSYGIFTAPTGEDPANSFDLVYTNVSIADDALHVRYAGGLPWAYFYFKVGAIGILFERFTSDFSGYDRMRLELKRDAGTSCSDLRLEIKDIDDAEKGGLRSVPLELSLEWQTYTVALDEFVEADLTRLNVAAGFLFNSPQPCTFSMRDIRYLEPE